MLSTWNLVDMVSNIYHRYSTELILSFIRDAYLGPEEVQ